MVRVVAGLARRRRAANGLRERRIEVVALKALVLEEDLRAAVRRVAPFLQHEVQLGARRRVRRVGAAGGHGHLLEHVEVVVRRRRAGGAHVGDRHAVEVPRVVALLRAFRDVA